MRLFCILLLVCSMNVWANPYDKCSDVLHQGIFNTTIKSDGHKYDFEKDLAFCKSYKRHIDSKSFRNTKDSSDADAKLEFVEYVSLKNKSKSDFSQEEKNKLVDDYYRNHCHNELLNQSSSSDSYSFLQVESEAMTVAIKAWKKCMAKESDGLVCYATPSQNGKSIVFTVEWHERHSPAQIYVLFPKDTVTPVNSSFFSKVQNADSELFTSLNPMGSSKLLFERKNKKESVQIIVNAASTSTQTSCEYEIPSFDNGISSVIDTELEKKLSKKFSNLIRIF